MTLAISRPTNIHSQDDREAEHDETRLNVCRLRRILRRWNCSLACSTALPSRHCGPRHCTANNEGHALKDTSRSFLFRYPDRPQERHDIRRSYLVDRKVADHRECILPEGVDPLVPMLRVPEGRGSLGVNQPGQSSESRGRGWFQSSGRIIAIRNCDPNVASLLSSFRQ